MTYPDEHLHEVPLPIVDRGQHKANCAPVLCVDIGGTFIKAGIADAGGAILAQCERKGTPKPATPERVSSTILEMSKQLPAFGKMSVGFPGVVRDGRIITAPNLGNHLWKDYEFARSLSKLFACEVRILNDAVVQGLGVAKGPGLECLITLGTGMGAALFRDGTFLVQLELGQHLARDGLTYDQYVGDAACKSAGSGLWNVRVRDTIGSVRALVNCDRLYIGGGNARRIDFELPPDIVTIPVTAGLTGGSRLWHLDNAALFARAVA